MNKVIIMGRLGKDPEINYTPNGAIICKFTVATDRRVKQGQEKKTDWHNVKAFGKTAEFINNHFKKGKMILVEGRIEYGQYTNQENRKVYTTDIITEQVSFCGDRSGSGSGSEPEPEYEESFRDSDEIPF